MFLRKTCAGTAVLVTDKWPLSYLGTWSSVNRYIKTHGSNPVLPFITEVVEKKAWLPEEMKTVRFPLFLKLGRIIK